MPTVDINYLAVLIAALASYVLGALWYSPVLFGKLWMKLSKIDPKNMDAAKKHLAWRYGSGFIATVVMSYILAHWVDYAGAITIRGGLQAGFWAWLGFVATVTLSSVLWENKPFKLYLLNNTYHLVSLLLMGSLLAVWVWSFWFTLFFLLILFK